VKSSSQSSESFRTEEQFDNDKNLAEVDRLSLIEVKDIETKSERLNSDSILEAQNVVEKITL
jgi:hypothetical protein